ncbi:phosphoribosyl-AMP cyclohydrolase [Listeria ilorinensis]|uniref:phosphoribosyl-AMP cyclohydrolase n=1 Tax=Listeria ilorinensis TaxID=2867439 RepID=UPI001EF74BC3|nr:phosphoribosyl-AMP cyclohydrolase [Listeria ilorinensis]
MIDFNKGLVPAIIIDDRNDQVLMLAYMNEESYQKTLDTNETWFYSRSRQELWHKGATSGHIQKVKQILTDCDQDTLLIRVDQIGAACHTGSRSCFFNLIKEVDQHA